MSDLSEMEALLIFIRKITKNNGNNDKNSNFDDFLSETSIIV